MGCVPGANRWNGRCFMFHLHGQESEPEMSCAAWFPWRFSNPEYLSLCVNEFRPRAGQGTDTTFLSCGVLIERSQLGGVAWRKGMLPGPRNLRKTPHRGGQGSPTSRIVHRLFPADPETLILCQSWPDLCSCKANSRFQHCETLIALLPVPALHPSRYTQR